jgi:hypothetical protein
MALTKQVGVSCGHSNMVGALFYLEVLCYYFLICNYVGQYALVLAQMLLFLIVRLLLELFLL